MHDSLASQFFNLKTGLSTLRDEIDEGINNCTLSGSEIKQKLSAADNELTMLKHAVKSFDAIFNIHNAKEVS